MWREGIIDSKHRIRSQPIAWKFYTKCHKKAPQSGALEWSHEWWTPVHLSFLSSPEQFHASKVRHCSKQVAQTREHSAGISKESERRIGESLRSGRSLEAIDFRVSRRARVLLNSTAAIDSRNTRREASSRSNAAQNINLSGRTESTSAHIAFTGASGGVSQRLYARVPRTQRRVSQH